MKAEVEGDELGLVQYMECVRALEEVDGALRCAYAAEDCRFCGRRARCRKRRKNEDSVEAVYRFGIVPF